MSPRAGRDRLPYEQGPARLRAWVESVLGASVVHVSDRHGGMAPGCAAIVHTAPGDAAFVKAVGVELNPDTPTLYRNEIRALGAIGRNPLWAGPRAAYDDGA